MSDFGWAPGWYRNAAGNIRMVLGGCLGPSNCRRLALLLPPGSVRRRATSLLMSKATVWPGSSGPRPPRSAPGVPGIRSRHRGRAHRWPSCPRHGWRWQGYGSGGSDIELCRHGSDGTGSPADLRHSDLILSNPQLRTSTGDTLLDRVTEISVELNLRQAGTAQELYQAEFGPYTKDVSALG